MNSRTSLFNKSIIKSDFRRLWWVSALNAIAIFVTFTLNIINDYFDGYVNVAAEYSHSTVARYGDAMWLFALGFPVILGVLLFSYMQSGRASTFAHSIPVTRKGLYISHILSGLVMIIIPILLNTLVLALLKLSPAFKEVYRLSHVLTAMSVTFIYSLISFSGACLVSFIMGNTVASIIFTYVFGGLPAAVQVFITYFSEQQLYGYHYNGDFWLMNSIYIGPFKITEVKSMLLYLGLSAAFLIAGYFIYKIRNIENHSEIVGFPKLRPVFVLGAGLTTGCVGYAYFNGIFNVQSVLFLIPFGVLGIIIAQMIVKKTLFVPEAYKPVLIFVAFTFCLYGIFTYDLTGYENRIPEASEVVSVKFDQNINVTQISDFDEKGNQIEYDSIYEPIVTDKKDIESIINLHRELVLNRYEDINYRPHLTEISYTLKNGKTLKRTYNIDPEKYLAYLDPVVEIDKVRQTYFPVLRDENRTVTQVEIHDERIPASLYKAYLSNEQEIMNEILEALKTDLKTADGTEFAKRDLTFTYINIKYKKPAHYVTGGNVPESDLRERSESYYIRSSYKNTIEVLNKYGLYDALPKAEDIEMAGVEYYTPDRAYEETAEYQAGGYAYFFHKTFEKPEAIKELYEYAVSNPRPAYDHDGRITFITKDHSFSVQFKLSEKNLPELIR